MKPPPDPPTGLIPAPLKGAILLLTEAEFTAGIHRGRRWRRRQALARLEEHRAPTLAQGQAIRERRSSPGRMPKEGRSGSWLRRQTADE